MTGRPPLWVVVNGERHRYEEGATVATVIAKLLADPVGCAVACNGEVVPRSQWETVTVLEGDRIEVLGAAAGG